MLIDTHCHVHFNAYKEDMDDVVARTLANDVHMITIGTQIDTSRHGLEVAERYDGLWAAVGLHPNHLTQQTFWDDDELPPESQATPQIRTRSETFNYEAYKKLASHPKCVAIGETGLDWYRIPDDVDHDEVKRIQRDVFAQHAHLATEMHLPIIIHCRDAYKEQAELVASLIEDGNLPRRGVIHCFSGTNEEAQRFVELGFYISFSGVITFPPRKTDTLIDGLTSLQNAVRHVPLDRLLVETDSPYLTPLPHRGTRNEPWYVKFVAEKVSEIKKISFEEVAEATTQNAKILFALK